MDTYTPNRRLTTDYITPYYGPLVPLSTVECDPCNPVFWTARANESKSSPNCLQLNETVKNNMNNNSWSTAFGWHGDLNLRAYQYQFSGYVVRHPSNRNYWAYPPHTNTI